MRTNALHGHNNYGTYQGCLAYESYYEKALIVFTGISAKRYLMTDFDGKPCKYGDRGTREFHKSACWNKLIFITNEQLADETFKYYNHSFCQEARELVFDGKRGTRYRGRSSCGNYFWCKRAGEPEPVTR